MHRFTAYTLARLDEGRVTYLGRATGPDRAWPTPDPRAAVMKSSAIEVRSWAEGILEAAGAADERARARHSEECFKARRDGKQPPKPPASSRERMVAELAGFEPAVIELAFQGLAQAS